MGQEKGAPAPIKDDPTERITDVFRVVYNDRWVWLGIGVLILLASLLFASLAHASAAAPDPSGEPWSNIIAQSGPAAGAVAILGFFLRSWMGEVKTDIAALRQGQADTNLRVVSLNARVRYGIGRHLREESDEHGEAS